MDYEIVLPSATRIVSEEENKGVYEIDGLYPGYGHTLGSSLRRILLSSLPGAAITKVKIEGVNHEFSTIPGVMEDVVMILLNLKQIRFKLFGNELQRATLSLKGAKEVKGKDIKCPSQLEVINKDQHIATLTDKNANFVLELAVERGIGFVPSEELIKDKVAVGEMLLDAIFTPIRKVNYEVENMRVGDRTDYNRLRLNIETDGTIAPKEALEKALEIMKKQIESISHFDEREIDSENLIIGAEKSGNFDSFGFSTRTQNALSAANLDSLEKISQKTEKELLDLDGVGAKAITEIKKALVKEGLSLKEK
ncbi:DNA-directed RNA polymerase subunit alpha [Candidatus Giovannonibacteria bacterium]|nr:DNA-directed RNA polymerase subunit alpha [Candidatus Giovannonibacteria bacterium]